MSLSSAVQWWEEWQLRILVLGSLTIQLYLGYFAPARRSPSLHPFYRLLIWLSYLGGDALAIYALATLFNRQKNIQCRSSSMNGGSHDLEVLWAPVLLIHLGGRMTISAYNIEDNEMWMRHIGTALSQVAVTIYVFCTSWSPSADKRLLAAAVLLFILGVFRCFEKPYALKRASFNTFATSFHSAPRTRTTNTVVHQQYIQQATYFVQRNRDPQKLDEATRKHHKKEISMPDALFVDFAYPSDVRLNRLKYWWLLDAEDALGALRDGLSKTFNLIYTKLWQPHDQNRDASNLGNFFSSLLWHITMTFPIAPIVIFHISHKEAYRRSDIMVTYLLLYITYFSEIISFPGRLFFSNSLVMVAQHSLIGGVLEGNKTHPILTRIANLSLFKCFHDLFHRYFFGWWYSQHGNDIAKLVLGHVKDGWMNYITDVESYRKFSDIRGHWTLERNACKDKLLWDTMEMPFDESLILWHVATEFCFICRKEPSFYSGAASMSREISNYMMHLLSAKPEMLLPGSRITLFNTACRELRDIFQGNNVVSPLDKEKLMKIIDTAEKFEDAHKSEQGFVLDAWKLAHALMQLDGDEEKMWKVIRGVWIEMLCFSAARCRGYLHAKSLGEGGEYLTFVSLLMSHAGLEMFAERQQRVQPQLVEEGRVRISEPRIQEATGNQPGATVLLIGEGSTTTQSSASPCESGEIVVVELK